MITYQITTKLGDLENSYIGISEPWEFVDADGERETYLAQTEQPTAFEGLLNTDSNVISYRQQEPGVYINDVLVTFAELQTDVAAARAKGLSGQWAFAPETVEALLNYIAKKGE